MRKIFRGAVLAALTACGGGFGDGPMKPGTCTATQPSGDTSRTISGT